MKKSVSLICVYNNEEQLNNCLVKTLSIQSLECEMIFIDGSNGSFPSCASALNYGVSKSCGEVLIFTHQDIFLKTDSEIDRFSSFILNMPKGTIVGVAGAKEKDKCNIGNYTSGINIDRNLVFSISEPKEVSCIDECFFGMRRDTFNLHPFDENLCDDWHLYAVEQCLYHRKKWWNNICIPSTNSSYKSWNNIS